MRTKAKLSLFPLAAVLLLILSMMSGSSAYASEVQPAKSQLTFCDNGLYPYVTEESLEPFRQAYPSMDVQIKELDMPLGTVNDWYTEKVSKGFDECDIFVFFSGGENLEYLIRRGVVAPLQDAVLTADVWRMDRVISDFVSDDRGVLYAYPVEIQYDFHSVNASMLEKTGLGDVPASMSDYVTQLLKWYLSDDFASYRNQYRFEQLIHGETLLEDAFRRLQRSYIHAYTHCELREDDAPLAFNTPAFRDELERLKILTKVQPKSEDPLNMRPTIYGWPHGLDMLKENETLLYDIPFTKSMDEQVMHAYVYYFVVNPNSQHREEAMTFLRWYAANKTPEQAFLLCPSDPYTGDDEELLSYEQEYREIMTNTCLDRNLYHYIMTWRINVWDIISPYFKGEATSSEVLTELDRQIAEELELLR